MVLGYLLVPQLLSGDKQHLEGLTRLYLFFLPLNFISLNLIALEQGQLRWGRYNLLRLSESFLILIFLLFFWWARIHQVYWFVTALLFSNLVTVVCCLWIQRQEILSGKVSLADAWHIFKLGLPFFSGRGQRRAGHTGGQDHGGKLSFHGSGGLLCCGLHLCCGPCFPGRSPGVISLRLWPMSLIRRGKGSTWPKFSVRQLCCI